MSTSEKKYRFLLMQAFQFSRNLKNSTVMPDQELPKEQKLFNYENVKHLLDDVDWDFHPGPVSPYGDWPVENREEFCLVAAARLPMVRETCESGKYNAIVLLGGGDLAESHNMYYYNLVVQHHFSERCASIRNINFPLPRPGTAGKFILDEREKAIRGEPSEAVDAAVREAIAAIEEDGAEVIIFGCSATFWLQPFVQGHLEEMGWEVPVLEGYGCSIVLAKAMVDLGVDVSGLFLPGNCPKKWRRKKIF
jgi:allantoin racemase